MSDSTMSATHRHVKRITATGVSEESATAIMDSVTEVIGDGLATKADLRAEIATAKFDLLKWIFVALTAQGGLIIGIIALIIKSP